MIVNFSVENFGSIKEKQTLSFEASKDKHLEDSYIINSCGKRLLKIALIYGANASGKTTVLKALEFLRDIVISPEDKKSDTLDFTPFIFDANTPKQSSIISIEFIHNELRYLYQVEFTTKAIISEEMYSYSPRKAVVFKRKTNLETQFTQISFGSKVTIDTVSKKTLESNTLWNNTVLGGYLKTNVELKELQDAVDWFKNYLKPLVYTETQLEGYVSEKIEQTEIVKADVINILRKADFNISDVIFEKEKMPDELIEILKKKFSEHESEISNLQQKGKMTTVNVEFEHTVNNVKYKLPLELESQGTQRYYSFAGLLSLLIRNSITLPIDELEASLHPELYLHFLICFLQNSKKSQIIATTHNREVLDNRDIFRDDAIWFTDKQKDSATELYSLYDFDSSVVRNTTNVLNAYKSGRLNGIPNLGDTFMDLSDE